MISQITKSFNRKRLIIDFFPPMMIIIRLKRSRAQCLLLDLGGLEHQVISGRGLLLPTAPLGDDGSNAEDKLCILPDCDIQWDFVAKPGCHCFFILTVLNVWELNCSQSLRGGKLRTQAEL